MSMLFGGGQRQPPPAPYTPPPMPEVRYLPSTPEIRYMPSPAIQLPEPPRAIDPTAEETLKRQKELEVKRQGRRSTLLTGGQGLLDDAPINRPLLGAGR